MQNSAIGRKVLIAGKEVTAGSGITDSENRFKRSGEIKEMDERQGKMGKEE